MISAAVIIVFFCVYVASGLVAGGALFEQVFGLEAGLAMTITVLVIVSYTFLGGFIAVSMTDFLQGSLMWVAVIAVPLFVVAGLGGFGGPAGSLESVNPDLLSLTSSVSVEGGGWTSGGALGAVGIASGLAWGLGYFGQPHILARFMGIRSTAEIPLARRISTVWVFTGLSAATLVGLVAITRFDEQLSNPETAFIGLIQQVVNPWIGEILLAAILAAVMSTADS